LPRPEVVPFRLTQNMLDAFGPTGSDGIYTSGLQTAMTVLRDNRDTLLSVLEPFTKDPVIDWRRNKGQQQRQTQTTLEDYQKSRAKRAINVIDGRLQGIYNLKNPNIRKFKRRDGQQADHHDDIPSMSPLSVDGQVHKLIAEATSNENLVQLYVGWMPWV
jgi:serine/threonine-protein kinase ATR